MQISLFMGTQLGHIQGSLPRGRHSFLYSFSQYLFGVFYHARYWDTTVSETACLFPRSFWSSGEGGRGCYGTGITVMYSQSQRTCSGYVSLDSLGIQREALSDEKVNSANTAGSQRIKEVLKAIFHEGKAEERCAVMLKWEKSV